MNYRNLLFFCLSFLFSSLSAQKIDALAIEAIKQSHPGIEVRVQNSYASPSGVRHVYLAQQHQGIPVFGAKAVLHYRDGREGYRTDQLVDDLTERADTWEPLLTVDEVFRALWTHAGARIVKSELVYYPLERQERVPLAWQLTIDDHEAGKFYLLVADATDGEELLRQALTLSCDFGPAHAKTNNEPRLEPQPSASDGKTRDPAPLDLTDGSFYHVFPFGLESPLYGDRQLIFEPADPVASPFGWHDTNGVTGPEHTITRGNNTYTYRDATGAPNTPDSGFVADGGIELDFDFFYAPLQSPDTLLEASLTQLFYTTNAAHDWFYRHGFDEAAGNFQSNNYNRGGIDGDPVLTEAQDESGTNNANFATLADGVPGRMQMYLWTTNSVLYVDEPADLMGERLTGVARFGRAVGVQPTQGRLVLGLDGSDRPELACNPLVNPEEVDGNIAMITRGECFFQTKAFYAQEAGAIAVIICNPENNIITMSPVQGLEGFDVTIPTIMLRESDCIPLRQAINAGEPVTITLRDNQSNPVDGTFDNAVVIHEYAHGVSNRLVGGPADPFCLGNEEQMGEGWSDFFALAATPQSRTANPTGGEARSIGNYSTSAAPAGRGIRNELYSTDPAINSQSYDEVITTNLPHGLGEIWASTLWDIYWAMVDVYGFDDDLINGNGGNNLAVRLVVEAMKYTPCRPGLPEARDALLIADQFENNGDHQCLLWEIFAKRGLGFTAEQGSSQSRGDNREAFDVDPSCIETIKLAKSVDTTNIDAGGRVTYTLSVRNDKSKAADDVTITDFIPEGMTVDPASIRGADEFSLLPDRIVFRLGRIGIDEQSSVVYTVTTAEDRGSTASFFDGAEGIENEVFESLSNGGTLFWERTDTTPYAGALAWYIVNAPEPQDQTLQLAEPLRVVGTRPALRFFTQYDTEAGFDAGIVQISTDAINWENLDGSFLRHDYRGLTDERGTELFRTAPTFWGDSDGYQDVIIDLSAYRGREVYFRWRFIADETLRERGWWIDNVELIDELFNYDPIAILATADNDRDTAQVGELGVVINTGDFVDSVVDPLLGETEVTVFPNPVSDLLTVTVEAASSGPVTLELLSVDGRRVLTQSTGILSGVNAIDLTVADLPAGVYVLHVTGQRAIASLKITIN